MKSMSLSLVLFVAASSVAGMAQQQSNEIPTNLAGATTIAAPPAGFNALTASDEDLAFYGFPPRPDKDADVKGYASWAKAMTAPTKRIMPVLEQTSIFHGPAIQQKAPANAESEVSESTSYSSNWSGYVSLSGATKYGKTSYYYIISDFVVPIARQAFGACTGGWDWGSTWVGIDGWGSGDVLQAGVEFDALCSGGSSTAYYSPWYEWYPLGEVRISNFAIAPGDEYYVEIWHTSATQGYAYLTNYNANTSVEIGFTAPSGTTLVGNSAEWVTERPTVSGSLATLTNYIADPYWATVAYDESSKKYTPNGTHSFGVIMEDNSGHAISYPTFFSSNAFLMQDEGSAR